MSGRFFKMSGWVFFLSSCLIVAKNWNDRPDITQAGQIYGVNSKQYTLGDMRVHKSRWEWPCPVLAFLFYIPCFLPEQIPGAWLVTASTNRGLYLVTPKTSQGRGRVFPPEVPTPVRGFLWAFFFSLVMASSDRHLGPCFPILTTYLFPSQEIGGPVLWE